MPQSESKPDILPQRLCSEIQLFDLCDDESCSHKIGRFCTEPNVLARFEKIAEDELRAPERYISEEFDDPDADDGADGYGGDDEDEFAREYSYSGEEADEEE